MVYFDAEQLELLRIIRCVLHGTEDYVNTGPNIDYEELYLIARRNGVANAIADVVCAQDDVPTKVRERFRRQQLAAIAQQVGREHALRTLYPELDRRRIRCLLLKGTLLAGIYPARFARSMSDVDAYVDIGDMGRLHDLMLELGYTPGVTGLGNHYEYMLGSMVKIEYHPELVALESEYGRSVYRRMHRGAEPIAERMDVWGRCVPICGHEYPKQLPPEPHYAYVIMHMMNHFLTAGTGIRSIVDVWVMNGRYGGSWDRRVVDALLDEFGLATFERYALVLADRWFDLGDSPRPPADIDEETLARFARYILESGTYGSVTHAVAREVGREASITDKARYLLDRFFLPYGQMCDMYPVLKRFPGLLPLAWSFSVAEMLCRRGGATRIKLRAVMAADGEPASRQADLFDAMMG